MNYLGIDWGEKRIGLAFGDEVGVATPLPAATAPDKKKRMEYIRDLIGSRKVDAIVVGYPINMDGSVGFKAREVDAFIRELERGCALKIHRVDERLSSHQAAQNLRAAGRVLKREDRRTGVLDSRAAALILQDFLEQNVHAETSFDEPGK